MNQFQSVASSDSSDSSASLNRLFLTQWLLLLGVLLLLGGFLVWTLYVEHETVSDREQQNLAHSAKIIHDNLGRQIFAINNSLLSVVDDLKREGSDQKIDGATNRNLLALTNAMTGVRTMNILDAQGTVLASNRPELIGQNFSQRDYFIAARQATDVGTLIVSPPFKTVLGAWAINLARIIPGPDGTFMGAVTATLDPDQFNILLNSVRHTPDTWTALAHGSGTPFLTVPADSSLSDISLTQPGTFFSRHRDDQLRTVVVEDTLKSTGDRQLIAMDTTNLDSLRIDNPLVALVGRNLEAVYADWRSRVAGLIAFYLGLAAVAMLALYAVQQRQRKAALIQGELAKTKAEFESRWRTVLEATNQGVWDWNLRNNEVYFSPLWTSMLGYGPGEFSTRFEDWESNLHPDDRAQTKVDIARHLEGLTPYYQNTHRMPCKDGFYKWILARGQVIERDSQNKPLRIIGTNTDVTEQREQSDRINRISANIPGAIYEFLLSPDGRTAFPYANSGLIDILGIEPEAVRSDATLVFSRVHPDDLDGFKAELEKSARDLTILHTEMRVIHPQKGEIWISGRAMPQALDGGAVRWHGHFNDVTERKRQELALREAKESAESANRAKSAFVANMSHEIRTPMSAVLGLLQLLERTELTARQQDYIDKAQRAAESLLAILKDILDFSKVESGKMEVDCVPFRLDDMLRTLSVVLSSMLNNKEVEVLFNLDQRLPRVLAGDGPRLQQVLLNLAGNAIKFTMRGEVVITLRVIESSPVNARIEFSVRDTGIGIPADVLPRLFNAFEQADVSTTRRFGGTGLGLAISQRLVRLMGGELILESTVGVGTVCHFVLEFERNAQTVADETKDTSRHSLPIPRPLRVLVVDDNATARETLSSMAGSFGWQVEAVEGGVAAIERLHTESDAGRAFDIVLLDWVMPDMDGWEVAQHLRASFSEQVCPKIIMITSHGQALLNERIAVSPQLLDGFLIKPLTPSMLFDAVANVTTGHSSEASHFWHSRADDAQQLHGLRLLVVEDNALNQQVAQELLSGAGAYVQVANNGQEAIDIFMKTRPPFELVLMDIQMPVMDGYEATRVLRQEKHVTTPIVAMTANAMASDRAACLQAGMDDHVGKPINIHELIRTIQQHCSGKVARPELHAPGGLDHTAVHQDGPDNMEREQREMQDVHEVHDLPGALSRLDNNKTLFVSLVHRFARDQQDITAHIRQALQQGDRARATLELHTLKGLAATLGLKRLSRLAAEMEEKVKAGISHEQEQCRLSAVEEQLAVGVDHLVMWAAEFDPAPAPVTVDLDRARALLGDLDQMLAQRNMRAMNIFDELKQVAGDRVATELAALGETIARLDFESARVKVANLVALLK